MQSGARLFLTVRMREIVREREVLAQSRPPVFYANFSFPLPLSFPIFPKMGVECKKLPYIASFSLFRVSSDPI